MYSYDFNKYCNNNQLSNSNDELISDDNANHSTRS